MAAVGESYESELIMKTVLYDVLMVKVFAVVTYRVGGLESVTMGLDVSVCCLSDLVTAVFYLVGLPSKCMMMCLVDEC